MYYKLLLILVVIGTPVIPTAPTVVIVVIVCFFARSFFRVFEIGEKEAKILVLASCLKVPGSVGILSFEVIQFKVRICVFVVKHVGEILWKVFAFILRPFIPEC